MEKLKIQPNKLKIVILFMVMLLANASIFAQCYKSNIDVGIKNYNVGKYVVAKGYFTTALKCPDAKGGAEAKQWLQKCNTTIIGKQKRVAEEKKLKDERRIAEQNKPKIGDKYAGGIVFYLDNAGKHGKVCATEDQSAGATWNEAKEICVNLTLNGYSDWYLPSKDELIDMYKNLNLKNMGSFASSYYWSSSGYDAAGAWNQRFTNGYQARYLNKYNSFYVRAVRAF